MNETAIDFFKTVNPDDVKIIKYDLQLDFFKTLEESEIERLVRIVDEIKTSTNRVRKKLFAENGSLKMRVLNLEERLEILERNICLGKS